MKKLFTLLFTASLILSLGSCTKEGVTSHYSSNSFFKFNDTSFAKPVFDAEGGSLEISFATSNDWSLIMTDEWINASKISGTPDDANFTLTIAEYTNIIPREGRIIVVSDSKGYEINITQRGYTNIPTTTIYYTSTDNKIVEPYDASDLDATIVSNVYQDGYGIITFDKDITSLGTNAFIRRSNLNTITLPSSIETLTRNPFKFCDHLKYFYGKFASEDNRALIMNGTLISLSALIQGNYTLSSSVTTLGWTSLTAFQHKCSITIPESVVAFQDVCCTVTNNVEKFYGKFTSADNQSLIKDNKLYGVAVYGLTEFNVAPNVEIIGRQVFQNCSKLKSITLPSSVTMIEANAFNSCSNLTALYCKATTPPQIGTQIFLDIKNIPIIYVPQESVDAYKTAEGWSEWADMITG